MPTDNDAHPTCHPPVPLLPELVLKQEDGNQAAAAEAITIEAITALADAECEDEDPNDVDVDVDVDEDEDDPNAKIEIGEDGLPKKKRRNKKLPLTFHEAVVYSARGIYVDIESGQLRCSCNHKPCDKWDAYGYTRHFTFKCHVKYETERLDDVEQARLKDARESFVRMNPIVEEQSLRKKRKLRDGEKLLTVDELRVQERHWMEMWKDATAQLRQLRTDLKNEVDDDVRAELLADIDGMKKRKGDWAKLLGLNDMPENFTNV